MEHARRRAQIGPIGLCGALIVGALLWIVPGTLWCLTPAKATVIQDPGYLLVVHGSDCGSSVNKGTQKSIVLGGSINMPSWANQGTVFLNGWEAKYLKGDHHFGEVSVIVSGISVSSGALTWKATAMLADDNFDDPYEACYSYTALIWNDKAIDAHPFHADGSWNPSTGACAGNLNFVENKSSTDPLLVLASYLHNKSFATAKGVAVLPRGFDYALLPYGRTDHHLLQIAYNLDHLERFVAAGQGYGHLAKPSVAATASQVDASYVSWQTASILKDNRDARDFRFWEHVSALAGDDVGLVQPPFTLRPAMHASVGCVFYAGGVETEEVVIEEVPFEYAVPVLTGWDLQYQCPDDEHVLDFGVWLHDVDWTKKSADLYGTLKYKVSSILVDEDADPGHVFEHKVQILGLKAIVPLPDLVAVPTVGRTGYCKKNSAGGLTIVVRNQGKLDAAASVTRVDFGSFGALDVTTPAVPAGSEVTIDTPHLPPGCYDPNCRFTIEVDFQQTVKESDETNNQAVGECQG